MNAAKNGAKTDSCTAYVTFPPCSQCAASLIQAGIEKVICPDPAKAPERWRASFKLANDMLHSSRVKLLYYSEDDLCQSKTAPYVGPDGCQGSCTGKPANLEKKKTSTPSFADNFLPRRLKDA
jgi:deoxycytidylate deaminase